ncbi:MAG: CaiB/BaiF CoA transferase family protein [Acidimicrobiales bacterium]|jgi:benzylsuccinate CoA-transferase BbsF subunit
MSSSLLNDVRVCDFTGQLAGAGATRHLAAFGAQVIRIEDPLRQGKWDILRGSPPFKDERRGIEFGSGFQNHNVGKLGVTVDLRTDRGRELVTELVRVSDVVTENFASGVMERMGFGYEQLQKMKEDIIYVSNCGFGQTGPYAKFKSWGPIAQAVGGLTFTSGLTDMPPAGWGYSYMDHHGGYFMAIGILAALTHRNTSGEGQWVDMSCSEAGASLIGPAVLDYTVNGRPSRRDGFPASNRDSSSTMAPHGIYATQGDDNWVAISVRDDAEWASFAAEIGEGWATAERLSTVAGRLGLEDVLDAEVDRWTRRYDRHELADRLQRCGIPTAVVARPSERIDADTATEAWGLWPTVEHAAMGEVRVDGLPVHFSETDWEICKAAPTLGEDNDYVFGEILGLTQSEIGSLRADKVI